MILILRFIFNSVFKDNFNWVLYDSTANPNVKIWEMSIYDKIIIKKMLIIYNSAI